MYTREKYSPDPFYGLIRLTVIPIYLLLAFAGSGIICLFVTPHYNEDLISIFLMISSSLYMIFLLIRNISSKDEKPAELFYLVYMIFYYIVPGTIHVSTGQFPFFHQNYGSQIVLLGAICVLAFPVFVSIGYSFEPKLNRSEDSIASPRKVHIAAWVSLILGIFAAISLGLSFFMRARGDLLDSGSTLDPLQNIESSLARQLPFISTLIAIFLVRRRGSSGYILLFFSSMIFIVLNNPISIPRSQIASYIIAAIISNFTLTKSVKSMIVFALVLSQFSIFPMLSALQRGDITLFLSRSPLESYISNGDFDGFQSTLNVISYATATGLKWGHNLLSAVFFFVPRAIWPNKSIGTGGDAATFMRWPFINVSSPLPSEFYVDFGFVGVVLGGIIAGYLLRLVDLKIFHVRKSAWGIQIIPFSIIVGWMFILLRGSLVGNLGPIVASFSISWIMLRISSRKVNKAS